MDPLFGSETRGRLLEQLATSPLPQTAYRLGRVIGAEPVQVLKILNDLKGLVAHSTEGWTLENDLLRRFLLERSDRAAKERRLEKDGLLRRFGMTTSKTRGRRQVR